MKKNLVYIMSLRNAAADLAGQKIPFKGQERYMMSPLEYLVKALNLTELGDLYTLKAIIYDDDKHSSKDQSIIKDYGFKEGEGKVWIYPQGLTVQGTPVSTLMENIPSTYRCLPLGNQSARQEGKHDFEMRLFHRLQALEADVVLLDGLILILDELIRPGAYYARKVVNIHPGITRDNSPYQRRGAYATLDALYGARGEKVIDWKTRETVNVPVIDKTGASFHYVDNGIDSGEVIVDELNTLISPEDTILEMRWNNFTQSLFPATYRGLMYMAGREVAKAPEFLTYE